MKYFSIISFTAINIFMISIFSSCSGFRRMVIMPGYSTSQPIKNKSLAVIINPTNIIIDNPSSLNDDFGEGNVEELFMSFLKRNLPGKLYESSSFSKIEILTSSNQQDYLQERSLEIENEESLVMNLPKEGEPFDLGASKADFVLLLNEIKTYEENIVDYRNRVQRLLNYDFQYLFWDNNLGRIVAYGKANANNNVIFQMNRETWTKALFFMGRKMLKDSPFEKSL